MIQKIKKFFRLSNLARKIFWVARIFDATLPNFTNRRAIAPPVSYSYAVKNTRNEFFCVYVFAAQDNVEENKEENQPNLYLGL